MDWTNTGEFVVAATATAPGYASANAVGIYADVQGFEVPYTTAQALLSGSVVNAGTFSVLANAAGGTGSQAYATGMYFESGVNTLEVTNTGSTYFEGIIGRRFLPDPDSRTVTEADLDTGLAGVGTLTIQNGGNLILAGAEITGDPDTYTGPSYVLVDEFNVLADGTITFELQPVDGGTQPVGTYPQVFANEANLTGTLVADITPAGGLFADDYFWDNVIDAEVRNGGFDGARCQIAGPFADSIFLSLDCIEDTEGNIDLGLERTGFDDIPGLTDNGQSVGEGLECIYDETLTGGIADLLADLFLIENVEDYQAALDQLAGASYANYLQSFASLGVHYNDLLDHATSCEIPALAGSVIECRASSPVHLWGQIDYQTRKADGDVEAGGYRSKRWTALVGADISVGNAAILGLSLGKVSNKLNERRLGDNVEGDGFQVGAYGVFDPGNFYVKAMSTLSWFDGDSRRDIDFGSFGGTFAGTTRGDPDVKMWTFGLHGGARMSMGGNSVLTPFLNLDYVNATIKDFIEEGLEGANLHIDNTRMKRTFLTGGVKWATQMGGVVPEVKLAYRHRFGDTRATVEQAFLCQTDTACEFDIVSAAEKRGAILAGLSVGGKLGPVDLRLGYEGEFNRDIRSHAGNFRIILPLGGRAPAPAPVVAPPPPPPPPVIEQAPPPPPPPPPPPVERGERGQ
jgi:outer membrane autotransporter protein